MTILYGITVDDIRNQKKDETINCFRQANKILCKLNKEKEIFNSLGLFDSIEEFCRYDMQYNSKIEFPPQSIAKKTDLFQRKNVLYGGSVRSRELTENLYEQMIKCQNLEREIPENRGTVDDTNIYEHDEKRKDEIITVFMSALSSYYDLQKERQIFIMSTDDEKKKAEQLYYEKYPEENIYPTDARDKVMETTKKANKGSFFEFLRNFYKASENDFAEYYSRIKKRESFGQSVPVRERTELFNERMKKGDLLASEIQGAINISEDK
jgi:hypothetical protein